MAFFSTLAAKKAGRRYEPRDTLLSVLAVRVPMAALMKPDPFRAKPPEPRGQEKGAQEKYNRRGSHGPPCMSARQVLSTLIAQNGRPG
jgi:hypothetical protein